MSEDLNKDNTQRVASVGGILEGGKAGARRGPLGAVIGAIIGGLAADKIKEWRDEGSIEIFRAVEPGELFQIEYFGIFGMLDGVSTDKQFALNYKDAVFFRDKVVSKFVPAGTPLTIVSARISMDFVNARNSQILDTRPALSFDKSILPSVNRSVIFHGGIQTLDTKLSKKPPRFF